jgi:hypothetical protein
MITKEVGATKGLTKSELEARVNEDERTFGVLVKIDCAENGTVVTLNREVPAPAAKIAIKLDPQGTAQCDQGKTEVCRGRAYISGVCVKILVCR